jgi:hypothetical protein
MPPAEFKPTISAGERPQTYTVDRAATGFGVKNTLSQQNDYCAATDSTRFLVRNPLNLINR